MSGHPPRSGSFHGPGGRIDAAWWSVIAAALRASVSPSDEAGTATVLEL